MLSRIKINFISKLNKSPNLKRSLVRLLDDLFEFRKVTIGNLTRNPAYLKHLFNSKVIAKPGTLDFGGIFNPGALMVNDQILLIAKAQIIPWYKARGEKRKYFLHGNPVTFLLDKNTGEILEEDTITKILGFDESLDFAIEDLRMFSWKGKKMSNHSLVIRGEIAGALNQTSVFSALSVLNEKEKTFSFHGIPHLDFPVQNIEKNWVYQEKKDDLFLFYALNPYCVLKLEDVENLRFKTLINQQFTNKLNNPGGFGTMVSFSTNPIHFDEKYWLLIVHQIENKISGRCYHHWAVLLYKETLLPEKITSKPIFSGMGARGKTPGVRYISSILKVENEILFFAGEGDVYVTVTKRNVAEMETLFINL